MLAEHYDPGGIPAMEAAVLTDNATRHANPLETRSIALITGGLGPEREGSLLSGDSVASALTTLGQPFAIIDAADSAALGRIAENDVAFLTTHGWWGEDGKLQGYLEMLRIPYLGSGVLASATAMHKPTANAIATAADLAVPPWSEVDWQSDANEEALRLTNTLGLDLFVKPSSGGGSLGASRLRGEKEVHEWLVTAVGAAPFIASPFVQGCDVSIAVIEDAEGNLTVLPPLSTTYDADYYDYEIKHDVSLRSHQCPADLTEALASQTQAESERLFKAMGCRGLARLDFLVRDNSACFLEINTLPGLSRQGNLAQMAYAAGMSYEQLIEVLVRRITQTQGYTP